MTELTTLPTITVLGAGYVGLTTAALLAHSGYMVYAVEPNEERLQVIQSGVSFFYEDGLDVLIKTAIDNGTLIATSSYQASIPKSHIVFSSVGTPDNPDGSSNLTYVFAAATEAAKLMPEGAIYVQKSTVPVGTGTRIKQLFAQENKQIPYVSNPEFLREGTAVFDTLYFDRVVAGGDDFGAVQAVTGVYKQLELHRDDIADIATIKKSRQVGHYISTNLNSAELIKVTSNAFLALKISFANSIAKLSDVVGADVVEVMDAVGADKRIGRAFLNAGRGYGGGCFPKDISGLIASGKEYGVDLAIMKAAQDVNNTMPTYVIDKLSKKLDNLSGKKIAVLGLAFKAGTSDTRRSPGISIANSLVSLGVNVQAFDPKANEEASHNLDPAVIITSSIEEALINIDVIIIATDWPEFIKQDPSFYTNRTTSRVIVDAVNKLDKHSYVSAGLQYIGVGR